MNKETEVLWQGNYFSVIKYSEDGNDYEIMHESEIIITIPIINNKIGIRLEHCPPYMIKENVDHKYYTLISGAIDEGEDEVDATLRELKEEAGIDVYNYKAWDFKNNIPLCKSTDMRIYFSVIDILESNYQEPEGDGSYFEEKSNILWITLKEYEGLLNSNNIDFLFFAGYYITKQFFNDKNKKVESVKTIKDKIEESVQSFDKFLSPDDLKTAHDKWDDIYKKGREGHIEILEAAKSKDITAVNWLFDMLKKVISKAFWKYYMGPIKGTAKISQNKDLEFASEVYAMLLGDPEAAANPLNTFNTKKFTKDTDVLEKFAYYLLRYAQSLAFQMIRSETRGGITGQVRKGEDEPSPLSYEEYFSNKDLESAVRSYTDDIELKLSFESFLGKLKARDENKYIILSMKTIGDDYETIAKKVGISSSYVRKHLKDLQKEFLDFVSM